MKEPVRILSDLHLAHGVSRISEVRALKTLLDGAGTVIFNGDTWQEISPPWRNRSREMLEELRALCHRVGTDAVFLPGNHDPGFDHPGWIELAGGRIIVTHGDTLFPAGAPWKREVLAVRETIDQWWRERPAATTDIHERIRFARDIARAFSSVEHPTGRSFVQRAWDAAVPPQRAWEMITSWLARPDAACRFLDTYFPRAEVLVFGHFHLHGCWGRKGRLLIDTGSFLNPGRAHWIEWSNGWLTRGCVIEEPGNFQKGPTIDTWRFS